MASVVKNNSLFCTCCGGTFTVQFPIKVDEFSKQTLAFTALHKYCKQTYVEPSVDQTKSIQDKAMFWLNNGHVGQSSKTIWNCLMGNKNFEVHYPYDPSDFNRCYGLLEMVPEWEPRLYEVAALSKEWGNLVSNWDKLTEFLLEQKKTGKANGMYEFMETLIR